MYGKQAAFISAGGYHHHIGLNSWYSKDLLPAELHSVGLYHIAIVYPTRKDLAVIYDRLRRAYYPITGLSDHGVSEAVYLDDPDGNGVELYCDRPKDQWEYHEDGTVNIYTKALEIDDLLKELE